MKNEIARYQFPEVSTVQESGTIHRSLQEILKKCKGVELSFGSIRSMDLSTVQLTLSLLKTLETSGKSLSILEPLSGEAQDAFLRSGILMKNDLSAKTLEKNLRTLVKEHS